MQKQMKMFLKKNIHMVVFWNSKKLLSSYLENILQHGGALLKERILFLNVRFQKNVSELLIRHYLVGQVQQSKL